MRRLFLRLIRWFHLIRAQEARKEATFWAHQAHRAEDDGDHYSIAMAVDLWLACTNTETAAMKRVMELSEQIEAK